MKSLSQSKGPLIAGNIKKKMKKLIIVIIAIIKCHLLFSQEKKFVVFFTDAITNSVPVYSSDTASVSFTSVKEDAEKENWHDVEILGKSNNRYKVCITAINEEDAAHTNVLPWNLNLIQE